MANIEAMNLDSEAEATFRLSPSFVRKYKDRTPPFGFNGLGLLAYQRCVTVDTPVLCDDFTWRPAGDLKEGDGLIAFDEDLNPSTRERNFRLAVVVGNSVENAACVGIELEDGTTLYSTPDHPWLAFASGMMRWVQAKDLASGPKGAAIYLPRVAEVTPPDTSYEAGYLAAAFDGEGSFDKATGVCFIQTDNAMLVAVRDYLTKKGFRFNDSEREWKPSERSYSNNGPCHAVKILGGRDEMFRFLSTLQPKRLMDVYRGRLESVALRAKLSSRVKVVRVFDAGDRHIAVLSTSTGTHITSGFPSHNTYSRIKPNGKNEVWWETVRRVVEGTYRLQERHIKAHNLGWDPKKAQTSAQEMYDRIFSMKFLPPGRGLWAMGSDLTEKRGVHAALFNCAFRSTANLAEEGAEPFCWLMDASMLGVGVGFDVKGAGTVMVQHLLDCGQDRHVTYRIPDTREGWVESVRLLINSYLQGILPVYFLYGDIRPAGEPIRGFGGVASGPGPLSELHTALREVLDRNAGRSITVTTIVDIMNLIGRCVVAGNVRRTAEIVFGDPYDPEYLGLKDYRWDSEKGRYVGPAAGRSGWGWTSNNSVFCEVGQDYNLIADQTGLNGEPGYAWLENMRAFGRMGEPTNHKDHRAAGGNPCLEQTLEDQELCCLVETFPANHLTLDDYQRTLKFAYLYAKTVTLGKTHWPGTNRVMLRNRRIGTSMSGVQQFIAANGLEKFRQWCNAGYRTIQHYDRIYSDWFAVPLSIKTTSVKPSGTVSLLAGATPGMHWPEALHYIRRMRLSIQSDLVEPLRAAGYHLEPAVGSEDTTLVVSIPVKIDDYGGRLRTVDQVSLWEQVAMAAFLQSVWADNQVSCTVTFRPEEAGQIAPALNYFQYNLKGISFLPRLEAGAYPQMPYQAITEEEYEALAASLRPLEFTGVAGEDAEAELFCDSAGCQL